MRKLTLSDLRLAAHAAGLTALAWMLTDFFLRRDDYAANRDLMLRAGAVGLILLVASFACNPLARLTGQGDILRMRRPLGLYAFGFVTLHLLVYLWLDNDFALALVLRDLEERRSMALGLAAFVLLIPLAITSTKDWQRRLGRQWRTLHRLIYVALPLSVWHYLWLDRDFLATSLLAALIVAALFALRLAHRRQA